MNLGQPIVTVLVLGANLCAIERPTEETVKSCWKLHVVYQYTVWRFIPVIVAIRIFHSISRCIPMHKQNVSFNRLLSNTQEIYLVHPKICNHIAVATIFSWTPAQTMPQGVFLQSQRNNVIPRYDFIPIVSRTSRDQNMEEDKPAGYTDRFCSHEHTELEVPGVRLTAAINIPVYVSLLLENSKQMAFVRAFLYKPDLSQGLCPDSLETNPAQCMLELHIALRKNRSTKKIKTETAEQ